MTLALDENQAKFQIRGYKPGQINVNDLSYNRSIILSATQLIAEWPPQQIQDLKREHLDVIIELKPAILIIGTGSSLDFPEIEVYGDLFNYGIGVEIMNTSAACRTFNALTAEERNVVAALMVA